jgi:hypothetical protein
MHFPYETYAIHKVFSLKHRQYVYAQLFALALATISSNIDARADIGYINTSTRPPAWTRYFVSFIAHPGRIGGKRHGRCTGVRY